MKKAIIVDLDGTMCLFDNRGPFDYHKCDTDLPNKPVLDIVQRYQKDPEFTVIFVSGREDAAKDKTLIWLKKYLGYDPQHLFMRRTKDWRKDTVVKKELYEAHIKGKYTILFVLEDRDQVVKMWRSEGLTCFQVAEGDF
jgi:hypothetical protein